MANLVTLCGSATTLCHGHVESYRVEATVEGYLVPMGRTPEEWRVLVLRQRWQQPGDGWEDATPHPDQVGTPVLMAPRGCPRDYYVLDAEGNAHLAPWPEQNPAHPDDLDVTAPAEEGGAAA